MNNTSFNHVTKDGVFDNMLVQNLKVNQLTAKNWYQGVPLTNQFKFDAAFLNPEKTKYFEGGTFGIDKGFSATNNLGGVNQFLMNFSNLSKQDLEFFFEQMRDVYLEPTTIQVVNVEKPEINGIYYVSKLAFNNDDYSINSATFFPFEYRDFTYSYRKSGFVEGTPAVHQFWIYPLRSDGGVDDTPYMQSSSYNYEDTNISNLYNSGTDLGATSFFFVVFYTKHPRLLVRSEMDAFVKRYIDNVIYGNGGAIVSIEAMRDNFYNKYSAIRGSLDLVENFEVVDPEVAGGSGGVDECGGLYDNIPVASVTPGSDFKVKISYYNQYYHVAVADAGSGYDATSVGQTFTVPGTDLGVDSAPYPAKFDAVIKVTAVSPSGAITGVELVSGTAPFLKTDRIRNPLAYWDETDYGGNWLYTNYGDHILYNYGEIRLEESDEHFGEGSKYCCVYNDSIFSLMVTSPKMTADYFQLEGYPFSYYLRSNTDGEYHQTLASGDCYNPNQAYDISNQYAIFTVQPLVAYGSVKDGDIFNFKFNVYSDYSDDYMLKKKSVEKDKKAQPTLTKEEREKQYREMMEKIDRQLMKQSPSSTFVHPEHSDKNMFIHKRNHPRIRPSKYVRPVTHKKSQNIRIRSNKKL